ncbi:MAG: hypothetical protein QME25_04950, partial [Bacteroidota bacterium]|nr:hypothetical protein [Bacteroidota bacterium]
KILATFLITLLSVMVSYSQVIETTSINAYSDGTNIILRWNTYDETNVDKFFIERRAGTSGTFIKIATINPKGPSFYEYIDQTAFKSTASIYQYQIKIKFTSGIADQDVGPITVSHSVNSVKRTWGSIKAMFR